MSVFDLVYVYSTEYGPFDFIDGPGVIGRDRMHEYSQIVAKTTSPRLFTHLPFHFVDDVSQPDGRELWFLHCVEYHGDPHNYLDHSLIAHDTTNRKWLRVGTYYTDPRLDTSYYPPDGIRGYPKLTTIDERLMLETERRFCDSAF